MANGALGRQAYIIYSRAFWLPRLVLGCFLFASCSSGSCGFIHRFGWVASAPEGHHSKGDLGQSFPPKLVLFPPSLDQVTLCFRSYNLGLCPDRRSFPLSIRRCDYTRVTHTFFVRLPVISERRPNGYTRAPVVCSRRAQLQELLEARDHAISAPCKGADTDSR